MSTSKEPYIKPEIVTETFAVEMMQAACEHGSHNLSYTATSYVGDVCSCDHDKTTIS